jgi:hypothetical protein
MSKPTPLFSSHFGLLHRTPDWSPRVVGLKAFGLAALPEDWTPAFAVIPAPDPIEDAGDTQMGLPVLVAEFFREALAPLFNRAARLLIVRSSASVEQLECRGWLESKLCEPSPDDVARVASEVFARGIQVLRKSAGVSGALALVIQEFKVPRLYGHLSNERRASQRSNRWLCEIETPTLRACFKIVGADVRRPFFLTKPFKI